MTLFLTRIFAAFTLFAYLAVGTVAVHFFSMENCEISFSAGYLSFFKNASIQTAQGEAIVAPEQAFAAIEFPVAPKAKVIKVAKIASSRNQAVAERKLNELPFQEPVVLSKVEMDGQLLSDFMTIYKPALQKIVERVARSEATSLVSPQVKDEVSSSLAAANEVEEPIFLDYSGEAEKPRTEEVVKAESQSSLEALDKGRGAVDQIAKDMPEEVAVDDLITYDYSSTNTKAVDNLTSSPQAPVTTQPSSPKTEVKKVASQGRQESALTQPNQVLEEEVKEEQGFLGITAGFPAQVAIHATGTDLKRNVDLRGFELRFQDDLSEAMEDFGAGAVTIKDSLAEAEMTRSVTLLKRGYAPTNTDLILEKGVTELSLPMLEESAFNKLSTPFEAKGPVGAVLVELDDETELATLDVPFGKVVLLDGDMKVTTQENFRYQLFVGVKAGNALLTYKDEKGEKVAKVIHVHEQELTFDANIYEKVADETISLFEEDLLAREKSPLIIGTDNVKKFASDLPAKKISDHKYKVEYPRSLLAGRRYLELSHQEEPVFVGIRDSKQAIVPSENFMRFVLSKLDGAKLGNRCLVQVNLSKKVSRVDVGSESVANSLMTYSQMLDSDGKFYDSVSEKTRKIIVVGENQGFAEHGPDSKINVKISYEDGTVHYLGSYCSPNAYLVEQL